MKKISYLLLAVFCVSCSGVSLNGRNYYYNDGSKESSFSFVNDSVCFYRQTFLFDIDENYRETVINCEYSLRRDKRGVFVYLFNLTQDPDSLGFSCFKLPDSVINNSAFLSERPELKFLPGAPRPYINEDYYGIIDNISSSEMLYLKRKKLGYMKEYICGELPAWYYIKLKEAK